MDSSVGVLNFHASIAPKDVRCPIRPRNRIRWKVRRNNDASVTGLGLVATTSLGRISVWGRDGLLAMVVRRSA
jgi:hypothetical protein